jgi:hypothetical protein
MPLYVLMINYTVKDTLINLDPLCGVFDTLENVEKAIEQLIKDNPDITHKNFEVNQIELNEIYYDY